MPAFFNLPGPGPLLLHKLGPADAGLQYDDSGTVAIVIQVSGTEFVAEEYTDSATVPVDIQVALTAPTTDTFTIAIAGDDGSGYWQYTIPYTWPPAESWVDEGGTSLYAAKGESAGTDYYYANNIFLRWNTSSP